MSPFLRVYIFAETLSIISLIMANAPHLLDEDNLTKLSEAFEKLEASLMIDAEAIFDGMKDETKEAVNY